MRLEIDIAEHHYNNIMALDSVSLGRTPYKGIIMYSINAIKHGKVLEQEPTTENDSKFCPDRKAKTTNMETILHCIKNECVAYKDGKCLKYNSDQEPTAQECQAESDKLDAAFQDGYNNGYAQARFDYEQESTPKNYLGVDCIDRAKAQTAIEMNAFRYTLAKERGGMGQVEWSDQLIKVSDAVDIIRNLPPVTPQESRKGCLSIDDVMSVFDDFMCGEVDEDGTETFLKMLKDKAESEGQE